MRYSEMKVIEQRRLARTARQRPADIHVSPLLRWLSIAALLIVALGLAGCSSPEYRDTSVRMKTAGPVDLERYQGRWYEIARFPNRFEEGCVGGTADYTLNNDGSVKVVNTCRQGALDGPVETAEGVATKQRDEGDRLDVTFVPWLPFARGDYWILELDAGYSVVVIGNPAGTTGWVLVRTPSIPEARLEEAYDVLRRNGYDVSQMILVPQG